MLAVPGGVGIHGNQRINPMQSNYRALVRDFIARNKLEISRRRAIASAV